MMPINWNPDRRSLRVFGVAALAVLAALGAWAGCRHAVFGFALAESTAWTVAWVLWGAALVCGLLAAAAPAALRPLYVGLSLVAFPIGSVLSIGVLALVYYGVVTPIGLIMRLAGRDALQRRFDPKADSYWVRRRGGADIKRYFRQF